MLPEKRAMTAGVTGGITPVCCISEQVISVRPSPVHSTVRGDGGDLSVLGQHAYNRHCWMWLAGWLAEYAEGHKTIRICICRD